MGLSKRKVAYLLEHYRAFSDARLARTLGVNKEEVRKALATNKARRETAPTAGSEEEPPRYAAFAPRPRLVSLTRRDVVWGGGACLAALIAYLFTLPHTVTGEDSGELIAAAYTMGVAHPPGYPLWCILGKIFTLIPAGSIAWRVAFMSAFFGVVTVGLLYAFLAKMTGSRWASAAGALAFGFSAEFWEQSVIAEVYALNAAIVMALVLLFTLWFERRENRWLYLSALVFGLGVANHNTIPFLAPLFLGLFIWVEPMFWRRWTVYARMALMVTACLSLYAYLPLRSHADPPVDWGDPETLEATWDVISRKQYRFGFTENPRSPERFARQLGVFAGQYVRQFTPWLCWLPLAGLYPLWKKSRVLFALVAGLLAYTVLGFVYVLNFDIDKQSIWVNNVFWLPAYMMAGALLGQALAWLASVRFRNIPMKPLAVPLAGLAVALPLMLHYYQNDKSRYYWSEDYGLNVLRTLDEEAIYFPTSDHATFPVLYLQVVEGLRPDVTLANKYGYPEKSVYADMPREQRKSLRDIPSGHEERRIEDWVMAHTERPVFLTHKRAIAGAERTMENAGLLYEAVKPGEESVGEAIWDKYAWRTLRPEDTRGELTAEYILSDVLFARGRDHLAAGETGKGVESLLAALDVSGQTPESLNNYGSACAEYGLYDQALDFLNRAVRTDPDYDTAWRNMAKILTQRGDHERVLAIAERLLGQNIRDVEANWLKVESLQALGRPLQALEHLQSMRAYADEDPRVYREMGFILLNAAGDRRAARLMFAESLARDPHQPDLRKLMRDTESPEAEGEPGPQEPAIPHLPELPQFPAPGPQMPGLPTPGLPPAGP